MTPWTDRAGNFSPLKAAVFCGICVPAIMLGIDAAQGTLGPEIVGPLGARPITEAIHRTGDWAIRFLMLSLAVTPLRRILNWPKLILVRRMLGLAALSYALAHLTLYAVDLKLDLLRVASEIALRKAIVAQCDQQDGLADDVLNDPPSCSFDAQKLACGSAANTDGCLSPEELAVVEAIYGGAKSPTGKLSLGYPLGGGLIGWAVD